MTHQDLQASDLLLQKLVLFLELIFLPGCLIHYPALLFQELSFVFFIKFGFVGTDLFTEALSQLALEISIWKGKLLLEVLQFLSELSNLVFL